MSDLAPIAPSCLPHDVADHEATEDSPEAGADRDMILDALAGLSGALDRFSAALDRFAATVRRETEADGRGAVARGTDAFDGMTSRRMTAATVGGFPQIVPVAKSLDL